MHLFFLFALEILSNIDESPKQGELVHLKALVAPLQFAHVSNSRQRNFYLPDLKHVLQENMLLKEYTSLQTVLRYSIEHPRGSFMYW